MQYIWQRQTWQSGALNRNTTNAAPRVFSWGMCNRIAWVSHPLLALRLPMPGYMPQLSASGAFSLADRICPSEHDSNSGRPEPSSRTSAVQQNDRSQQRKCWKRKCRLSVARSCDLTYGCNPDWRILKKAVASLAKEPGILGGNVCHGKGGGHESGKLRWRSSESCLTRSRRNGIPGGRQGSKAPLLRLKTRTCFENTL